MNGPLRWNVGQAPPRPIRVLICDDSAIIRAAIARVLEADPAIAIAGRASNGQVALDFVRRETVDVVVLDIEMPVLGGLDALPLLLQASPGLAVLVASTLSTRGAETTLHALRLGALDYVPKPSASELQGESAAFGRALLEKIRALAASRRARASGGVTTSPGPSQALAIRPHGALPASFKLLAVGCSTGGPTALPLLLRSLGSSLPVPVIVTQHMQAAFTPILAAHLDGLGVLPCSEASDGSPLLAGRLYLAPGDRHLTLRREGERLFVRLSTDPPVNYCRPSVDVMFRSAAEACGGRVLAAMLTGMGQDGLAGTRAIVESGGAAVAQDEASSAVWGMPGAIARAGLCHAVLPLQEMGAALLRILGRKGG